MRNTGSLHTPMSFSDVRLTYKARDDMPEVLERHITELSEADIIIQLQVSPWISWSSCIHPMQDCL